MLNPKSPSVRWRGVGLNGVTTITRDGGSWRSSVAAIEERKMIIREVAEMFLYFVLACGFVGILILLSLAVPLGY